MAEMVMKGVIGIQDIWGKNYIGILEEKINGTGDI